ncbi:hypothetical protein [Facklamia miroungae]|uniref:DUF4352 domain-containing protein n=1 Tax=Facklamia miroungae TaxID=120956 RepID=A0A1G7TW62_9LACT|nr:hypothetical protein [Facklamia miroungae]NKZ29999.1 hypothetical protein [Facklamia miroungae]SDG39545.1 hypothetical protein SAMN05421791_10766 [Facklamia miroungae]
MKKGFLLLASMMMLGGTSVFAQGEKEAEKLREDISKLEKMLQTKKDQLKKMTGEESIEDKDNNEEQDDKTAEDDKINGSESVILVDDTDFYIAFKEINEKEDSFFGRSHEIVFEIENRTDEKLMVQADTASIDGKMIDPSMITFFQEIGSGKRADVKMSIMSYDPKEEIPELKGDLELEINAFNFKSLESFYTYDIMLPLDEIEINQ